MSRKQDDYLLVLCGEREMGWSLRVYVDVICIYITISTYIYIYTHNYIYIYTYNYVYIYLYDHCLMILTFAHCANDHCRQLWTWFWSMTMTEYGYGCGYNCDNVIWAMTFGWVKKSYRSQPPPTPRTTLGNGTCPLARTVRLWPQGLTPTSHRWSYKYH